MWSLNYQDRFIQYSLTSLELRRLIVDLVMCFKIVHGFISLNFNNYFTFDNASKTRGPNVKLRCTTFVCNSRQHFFSQSGSCLEFIALRFL